MILSCWSVSVCWISLCCIFWYIWALYQLMKLGSMIRSMFNVYFVHRVGSGVSPFCGCGALWWPWSAEHENNSSWAVFCLSSELQIGNSKVFATHQPKGPGKTAVVCLLSMKHAGKIVDEFQTLKSTLKIIIKMP